MRETQNQWSLLRRVTGVSLEWHKFRERSPKRGARGSASSGGTEITPNTKTHSKGKLQGNNYQQHASFITTFLNKCAPELWQEHRGESRWSPFHRIPCGNFRGLFPNPFKWTFHLSASSSVSAIPTVQPFLHHFLHNLAWSQGQNKCLWEIWSAHIGSKQRTSRTEKVEY